MAVSYYFKDEDEELKGPFNEDVVLDQYKKAAFTSDVQFQIRPFESDSVTPFNTLSCLIRENGHRNPFRNENKDIERLILLRQKEIEELSVIYEKKAAMEKKLDDLEKQIEEKMRKKYEEKSLLKTEKKADDGGIGFRRQKHIEADAKQDFPPCDSCQLVFSSTKQLMMHTSKSSCNHKDNSEFSQDFKRWKKEDEQRLATGQRMYKKMSAMEIGSSRPQIDFIEELHSRIEEKMVFGYDENGKDIARTWIRTEEAKKVNDRFVKHLKEAKGNLVCTRCQVACRSHQHFLIHLITYDHRLKVKGYPIELLSLLVGNFHKEKYLDTPDQSELDEEMEMGTSSTGPSKPSVDKTTKVEVQEGDQFDEEKRPAMKQQYLIDWAIQEVLHCCFCDLIFPSYKHWVLHLTTEEHIEKGGHIAKDVTSIKMELLFGQELQKWRWEERSKLAAGKRMFESMSEQEKKMAGPKQEFIHHMGYEINGGFQILLRMPFFGNQVDENNEYRLMYFFLSEEQEEGPKFMMSLENHLRKFKKLVCHPCKVAFDEMEKYLVHCQMSKHLIVTGSHPEKHVNTLIGIYKKDLYLQ